MAERMSGKAPFARRTHGSERRDVFPVPSIERTSFQLDQSRKDNIARIERINALRNLENTEPTGLGNQDLPAYKYKNAIIHALESNKAMILGGETGSGKSTQVPQFLLEAGYDKIYVLVPRRIIADGLGERIAEELAMQLPEGEAEGLVGIIHGERSDRDPRNKIVVMTPNTYNAMADEISANEGDKKVAIISDEIHEANLFTEIATGIAATEVIKNDKWRLIAASATHNSASLQVPFAKVNGGEAVPTVQIEGRPFNIEQREQPGLSPMKVYASQGMQHEKTMIFTSGKKEIDYVIEETSKELNARVPGSSNDVVYRKLHGELSEVELSHINDPVPEGKRLVIVSSPAGMSGITIPGVTLVVSDGTINRQELDDDGIGGLRRHYLSKAGIKQQFGRAGRDVSGGIGILADPITVEEDRLRAKNQIIKEPHMPYVALSEREDHEPPEIYSSNLGGVVLRVSCLDRQFSQINECIPHPVTKSAIVNAERSMFRIGAMLEDNSSTPIGRLMNKYSLIPELSRGVVQSVKMERTLQQLVRSAFIAAAVNVGGIQDFTNNEQRWRQLIRPTSADDFIAQLDLMSAVHSVHVDSDPELNQSRYENYDLHPKRIEQARKVARKILNNLMIKLENVVVIPPTPDEENELRQDFTAGMIDLVYQEDSREYKKIYYTNIHGDENAKKRFISGRSIAQPAYGTFVAGIPRWYEKRNKESVPKRYDVLEQTLLVDPQIVGAYAAQNGILEGAALQPRLVGSMVLERTQPMFGSIPVGEPINSPPVETIPPASQEILIKRALEQPGEAQLALRGLADELTLYSETIPARDLLQYRNPTAPNDITKPIIKELLKQFSKSTRSLVDIDRKLAEFSYKRNLTIGSYYDTEAREEMQRRSPRSIDINGVDVQVFYDNGQPYITRNARSQRWNKNSAVVLPDGREILLQVVRDGRKTRISLKDS